MKSQLLSSALRRNPRTGVWHLWRRIAGACVLLLSGGCSQTPQVPVSMPSEQLEGWARGGDSALVATPWLQQFESAPLLAMVNEALTHNFRLRQSRAQVREAVYGVTVAGAPLWPTLSVSADGSRRRTVSDALFSTATTDSYTVAANLNWRLDLWGELRASQRAAQLSFASTLAGYVSAEQTLAANVARQYFATVEAVQLEALFEARLHSLEESLDIIEGGYRSGLNSALDVYLAQNSVAQEQGNLAAARQTTLEARAALELLMGDYPAGQVTTEVQLPQLSEPVPVELPATLLTRRPDLQAGWLDVLAADARLAVAHRQRFPALTLSASASDNEASFNTNKIFDGGPIGWSLAGSLTQPLFQGGRLLASEKQARERLLQTEAVYLDVVYAAFAEVENGISQAQALHQRGVAARSARRNAVAALELAFEQYRSGIVSYTTVLESQRRAFDAQTSEVRLAALAVQNRISLNLSLGGAFDDDGDQRLSDLLSALPGWAARHTDAG